MADEPGTISTPVACQLLMLSQQRLGQLERDGWIKRVSVGVWRTVDLVQGYIRFLKSEERRTSKTATLSRMQEAKARQIDLKVAREQGEVVEMADARAVVIDYIGAIKAGIDGLPARCTRDLPTRRIFEAGLNDILDGAANRLAQQGAALRVGSESRATATPDDTGRMGDEEPDVSE
jgi:hypothetical protein